jgi:hypothetical protein
LRVYARLCSGLGICVYTGSRLENMQADGGWNVLIEKQRTALPFGACGIIGLECKISPRAEFRHQQQENDAGRLAGRAGAESQVVRSVGYRGFFSARAAISGLFVALPTVLFYGTLFRHLVNLPFMDDYDILQFLNQIAQVRSAAAKLALFLAWQHNVYKLFFVDGLSWAQFAVLGHVNFAQLCVLGDSAVLVLAFILWSMFLPGQRDLARRLALFVPVSWLLFQMVYWETLNWTLGALQNLWVIVFSLGAILCVLRPTRKAYIGALVLYALAIAASGNGFFVLPVGLLTLAKRRQYTRAGGLLALTALGVAAYAYHYDFISLQEQPGGSAFSGLRHWRPDYPIAFVGNAGILASHPAIVALRRFVPGISIPPDGSAGALISEPAINLATCLALGTFLLALFGWLMWRGYPRRNPWVSSSVLFLLLTAAGVAGLRSGIGVWQSLSPRYAIYGTLLLILAWMAVAEEFLEHRSEGLLGNGLYTATTVAAIVLALCTDVADTTALVRRNSEIVLGMQAFEHPATPGSSEGPMLADDPGDADFHAQARETLTDSIRLGVYEPPRL